MVTFVPPFFKLGRYEFGGFGGGLLPRKRGFLLPENRVQDQRLDGGGGDGIASHEAGLAGDEEGGFGRDRR